MIRFTIERIARSILRRAQVKQEIFSYGASSPDGDSRYSDYIRAYFDNNQIIMNHIGGGAAGGMDSFTPGIELKDIFVTLKMPEDANKIIGWIRRSLNRYTFLKYVKLRDIKWTKANGSEVRGLSQGIVSDVLKSYGIEMPKPLTFAKWVKANEEKLKAEYKKIPARMKKYYKTFDDFAKRMYINSDRGGRSY